MKPRTEVRFDHPMRRAFLHAAKHVSSESGVRNSELSGCGSNNSELRTPNSELTSFLLNHARSGLLLALQSLHLPHGSKVGMMVYNCHTVMNAIAQAGCKIIFIDVDNHLHIDMDDLHRKSAGLEALVVTHLFGIINDVSTIQELYPDLFIVEDCAHAYGKDISGDFGVYSIGQGKFPSLGDGGILIVNGEKHLHSLEPLYSKLPSYSNSEDFKLFCKLMVSSLLHRRQIYGLVTLHLKHHRKPNNGKETIVIKKMSSRIQSMYELEKVGIEKKIELRKKNVAEESIKLQDNPLVKDVFYGDKTFMLIVHCTNTTPIKEQYRRKGVEADTHFKDCILWAKAFGYNNDCPNAERLVKELIMVPIY